MAKRAKRATGPLPSTLERSSARAQRTFAAVRDAAVEQYGEGERAQRTAFAALKHGFEKIGDRWVAKAKKGPSDPRATRSSAEKRLNRGETFGGVDYFGHTKGELYARAKGLDIKGRARMSKADLARAIGEKQ